MKFGKRLVELREKRNLSQEELADELNVSRQTVSDWENDKVSIDVDKAAEICRFFGVDMNYLFIEGENANLCEDPLSKTSELAEQDANRKDQRSQSTTKIWRSSIIISVILFAIFAVFEIVICVLHGDISNTTNWTTQKVLFLGAIVFGGLAMLMSVVMLILSVVIYCKCKQKDCAQNGHDESKQ